ncbi:Aste57867_162 [Aphanomyces stellatus]|uniref:Aste57867_162 protein n=1 Tax=Aphanomyces stellatus TaxID=120398 RepID=A0A485K2C6_9STRA|nr:hypothetical protein As57867_000162 [Aphanomyces stellatus]VFT77388.1 Aste57867_162 [Aphanomyces stellatus]
MHGSYLYITGDVAAALDMINRCLELDPTNVNSIKKAGFLCELGDFELADKTFQNAATLDDNSTDVYLHNGQMGDYSSAVATARRSITLFATLVVFHISFDMAMNMTGSIYQSLHGFWSNSPRHHAITSDKHLWCGFEAYAKNKKYNRFYILCLHRLYRAGARNDEREGEGPAS